MNNNNSYTIILEHLLQLELYQITNSLAHQLFLSSIL
jgi:hypothetical protein